jgi:hypothetical protein
VDLIGTATLKGKDQTMVKFLAEFLVFLVINVKEEVSKPKLKIRFLIYLIKKLFDLQTGTSFRGIFLA